MRVAVLTEIISPYRIPLLNELASDSRIELEVFFFSETEGRRRWRIPWEKMRFHWCVLPGMLVAHRYQGGPIFFNPSILGALRRGRFQAVVCFGYHHPTIWMALLWCRVNQARALLWSESTMQDTRSLGRAVEWMKRKIITYFDSFIAAGTDQVEYLRHLGASLEKIWVAPDAVDSEFFSSQSIIYRKQQNEIMNMLRVEGPIVLYVGRLLDAKGIPELLSAFEILVAHHSATLILIGDGPDQTHYQEICKERGLNSVRFEGFRPQVELPRYYAIADVLVFPTRSDPWGLVINEAMCSGLPVICSAAAGAARDLVRHGHNGFVHQTGDVQAIASHLESILADPETLIRMGECSREIISGFTPRRMAHGFLRAILGIPQNTSPGFTHQSDGET